MKTLSELPENAIKINSIFDLVIINPQYPDKHEPRYGGKIYIKSVLSDGFEEYEFNEQISSEKINKYIQSGQLYFVK